MSRHFGGLSPAKQTDRARTLILVSVFFVFLFSTLAFLFLSSNQPVAGPTKVVEVVKESPIEMVDVLVPVQGVEAGRPLEPSMFRKESKPKLGLSPRVVKDYEEIKGFYARTLIVADQPLHNDYITKVRPVNEITEQIPEGYRAVTIRVDQTSSVEGWARPGAQVDIVWASKVRGKSAVTVIVENAKVLSAERITQAEIKPGMPVPSTVTLLVTAEDAKKIQLATTAGSLSLNLRGDSGGSKGGAGGTITIDDLLANRNADDVKAEPECRGKVKTCGKDGKCEELCLKSDGSMVPMLGE